MEKNNVLEALQVLNDFVNEYPYEKIKQFYKVQPLELRNQVIVNGFNGGLSVKDIAIACGLATSTIYSVLSKHGIIKRKL